MKLEKSFFIKIISSFLLVLFLIGVLNYYCDPLQIFNSTKYGNGEQRYINYGIARNHKYDTVVIGTSTSENILKKDLKEVFGFDAVNLSISGSTSYEQREILQEVLKNKDLKNVLYGLDIFSYNRDIDEERLGVPKYIKDNRNFLVLKEFYSLLTLKNSIKGVVNNIILQDQKNWIDKHSYWGDKYEYSKELTVMNSKDLKVIKTFQKRYDLTKMKNNFDLFLEITQKNQDVQYIIYLPPYSYLFWNLIEEYDDLESIMKFKEYIFSKVNNKKNIKIYDFQNDLKIIKNLDNFKDIIHYCPKINLDILNFIKNNKN